METTAMPAPGADAASSSPAESVTVSNPSNAPRPTLGAAVVMRCMGDQVTPWGAGVTVGRRYGKDHDVTWRAPAWTTNDDPPETQL